jgi:hypothetical protein
MINKFETLPATKKVNIMRGALDLMNQYNGRNNYQCIFMAMGYQEDDEGRWHFYVA